MIRPDLETRRAGDWSLLFAALATLGMAFLALTNQSLWIDEAHSAVKAIQPSLASWWHLFAAEKGSDLQMPFYMLWLWAWEKMAGHSELALRAANLPWLFLAHYFLFRAGQKSFLGPIPLLVLASLNPFLWVYLNEARPYVMQYAAACVLGAFLCEAATDPAAALKPVALWIFTGGLLLLCGSSLLGVIWAAFSGAAWLYLIRGHLRLLFRRPNLPPLALASLSLGALGLYYFWTLRSGAGASTAGRTGFLSLAFVIYELLGVAGLGPGRLDIREHGVETFRIMGVWLIPVIGGLLFSLGLLGYGLARAWAARGNALIRTGLIATVPPLVLLFVLGYAQDFRLLGRHFMPLVPTLLGLFMLAFSEMKRRPATVWAATLAAIWLTSSLSLRFGERHRKDDYRAAAGFAQAALRQGESVWWSADPAAATYYALSLAEAQTNAARPVIAFETARLAALPLPDLVITSKPDIYDPAGQLGDFLRTHDFRPVRDLPAFRIWRRASALVPPEGH